MKEESVIVKIVKGALEKYWFAYCLVYAVCVVLLLWRHWVEKPWNDTFLLAAICSASAGIALWFAIVFEGTGRMVLLIPGAVKKLKDAGRKEERKRIKEVVEQLGSELSPEVRARLLGESSDERS